MVSLGTLILAGHGKITEFDPIYLKTQQTTTTKWNTI